jgi:hypothetical protein
MSEQNDFLIVPPAHEVQLGLAQVERFTRKQALVLIWRHKHRDFKSVIEGKKFVMVCRGGTCLVELEDLTDEEINDDLRLAVKLERKRVAKKAAAKEPA